VGDLAACHAAFERLQQRVLELSLQQQASVEDDEAGGKAGALRRQLGLLVLLHFRAINRVHVCEKAPAC